MTIQLKEQLNFQFQKELLKILNQEKNIIFSSLVSEMETPEKHFLNRFESYFDQSYFNESYFDESYFDESYFNESYFDESDQCDSSINLGLDESTRSCRF